MGKYGTFQIGLDISERERERLLGSGSPMPGILEQLIKMSQGLAAEHQKKVARSEDLQDYEAKKRIDARYREPKSGRGGGGELSYYDQDGARIVAPADAGTREDVYSNAEREALIHPDGTNEDDPVDLGPYAKVDVGAPDLSNGDTRPWYRQGGQDYAAPRLPTNPLLPTAPGGPGDNGPVDSYSPRDPNTGRRLDTSVWRHPLLRPTATPGQVPLQPPMGGQPQPTPTPPAAGRTPITGAPSNPTASPSHYGPPAAGVPPVNDPLAQAYRGITDELDRQVALLEHELTSRPHKDGEASSLRRSLYTLRARRAQVALDHAKAASERPSRASGANDDLVGQVPWLKSQVTALADDPEVAPFATMNFDVLRDEPTIRDLMGKVSAASGRRRQRSLETAKRNTRGDLGLLDYLDREPTDEDRKKFSALYSEGADQEAIIKALQTHKARERELNDIPQMANDYMKLALDEGLFEKQEEARAAFKPRPNETKKDFKDRVDDTIRSRRVTMTMERSERRDQEFRDRMRRLEVKDGLSDRFNSMRRSIKEDEDDLERLMSDVAKDPTAQATVDAEDIVDGKKVKVKKQDVRPGSMYADQIDTIRARLSRKVREFNDVTGVYRKRLEDARAKQAAGKPLTDEDRAYLRVLEFIDVAPIDEAGGESAVSLEDVLGVK